MGVKETGLGGLDDEGQNNQVESGRLWEVSPPRGTSGNARATNNPVRQRTQRTPGLDAITLETGRERNPRKSTERRRTSHSEHLQNNLVRPLPHQVQSRAVFFEADKEHPVHLSQLILRAGDVEENPGPHCCGICDQKVTSNCIKCTWCERWIHQKCSGLTKQDIKQFAKAKQYAHECDKCKAPRSNFGG